MIDFNAYVKASTEGKNPTYGVSGVALTPDATPTDVVTVYASAAKSVKVKKVIVSGVATTAGTMNVSLVKRTAANTGGTSTSPSIGQFDSADSAATATVKVYSAKPTSVGAGVAIASKALNFGVAGAAGIVEFDFTTRNDKALYLRGAAQGMAINLNGGAVPSGGALGYAIEFEEL
ncbi:hypothetical protein AB840_11295 [Megasphaera cerevisiae DSM 20462]|uniref:Uncharacterized protein n=1 Tax=Megasphaera cerevisiae DSM 20462 TaxID=1122219 RepID=A0A0J6WQX1_9FIRM|nr:hypothetical protein [Megasphaera cerevisiae]KMO85850.1 hypothetical protein AB840_11295 [Megasphaera cerevisiae DSM 20462]SJZ58896.1 hypothetical protein SAMN05660900_00863 [Megasphaera cerevisiae DSM 20462]